MSAAAPTPALPPQTRSARLLALVRKLLDYGQHLAATLRQRTQAADPHHLTRCFGVIDLTLILARITLGLHRARLLEERIVRTAARLDAAHAPRPAPSREPGTLSSQPQPRTPKIPPPQPTDTDALPTPEQIAAKIRRQPIGAVLADICRDLGITRGHPLWEELHLAINDFGGNFLRLAMEWLNRAYPIAPIVARLKAEPAAPPAPVGTGPPLAVPA